MPVETRALTDTVVVVTGASSGIGAATVRLLAEAGALVLATARREDRLKELVAEFGDRADYLAADIAAPETGPALVERAVSRFGRLDSIVVNAGIGMYAGITEASTEDLSTMLRTNVDGTVWPIRAAVEQFRTQGTGGDIVITASVAGLRGGGTEAVYAATKFAQVGLAGSLDREVRPEGIRVSTIAPAAVSTEFAIGRGRTEGDPALEQVLRPDDVGNAILTVLTQPRRVRTTLWALYSMAEAS
jgi:NADP-dependent 3-hydroxy acid dehydrogenase YdfG